jgi:hypothetical protein
VSAIRPIGTSALIEGRQGYTVGKKFRGKLCAYCAKRVADTDEHIFSRQFFTVANRANLPKAPACRICNGAKAKLEHYLTVVVPFGGRHPDALVVLETMVPPRLAKNAKLHRKLAAYRSDTWARTGSGLMIRKMALPFDSTALQDYFAYAVRGLLWHHWSMYLPEDSFVDAMCITAAGERIIEHQLSLNARARVSENLGNGTIAYRAAQGIDRPDVSVWQFKLYGGIVLAGDPTSPDEDTTTIAAFTAPRRAALNAKWRSSEGGLRVEALFPPPVDPKTGDCGCDRKARGTASHRAALIVRRARDRYDLRFGTITWVARRYPAPVVGRMERAR